jgi:hypothetical protein
MAVKDRTVALWRHVAALALCAAPAAPAFAHGVPDEEAQRLAHGGPFDYLLSGAVHMVTGY